MPKVEVFRLTKNYPDGVSDLICAKSDDNKSMEIKIISYADNVPCVVADVFLNKTELSELISYLQECQLILK